MVCALIIGGSRLISAAGDIIYTSALNMDIIVLNSEQVATELLENRSKIYSDRPFFATTDLCVLYVSNNR